MNEAFNILAHAGHDHHGPDAVLIHIAATLQYLAIGMALGGIVFWRLRKSAWRVPAGVAMVAIPVIAKLMGLV